MTFRLIRTSLAAAIAVLLAAFVVSPAARAQRPLVIIGGWSNEPEDFVGTPLVDALSKTLYVAQPENAAEPFRIIRTGGGKTIVLLTRHKDKYGDIDENAKYEAAQIVKFLDTLRAGEKGGENDKNGGGRRFDLVGFSMGGLIARAILLKFPETLGKHRVAQLVTMGTPNHGVNAVIAAGGILWPTAQGQDGVGAAQMIPSNPYLLDLNRRRLPASIPVTTIAGTALVEIAATKKRESIGSDGLVRVTSVRLKSSEAARIVQQHVLTNLWHTEGTKQRALDPPNPKPFINGRDAPPENPVGNPPPLVGTGVDAPVFFTDPRIIKILVALSGSGGD